MLSCTFQEDQKHAFLHISKDEKILLTFTSEKLASLHDDKCNDLKLYLKNLLDAFLLFVDDKGGEDVMMS